MSQLPQFWTVSMLGEVCSKPQYGWTSKASKTGKLKYVRTTDISSGKIQWDSVPYCGKLPSDVSKYRLNKDDVLVSRAGSVGVSYRVEDVPAEAVFASYLIRFNTLDGIPIKYIEYFLKSDLYWRSISEFTAGIAIPNVNASKLSSLEIPIPPLNEQRRIVAKLDQLLPKVQACQERLEKIPLLLKRFRQSVLAAACAGKLTEDWRLDKIRGSEWSTTALKQVLSHLDQGWSPKCEIQASHTPDVWGVIKTTSVQAMRFIENENKKLPDKLSPRPNLELKAGDLLMTRAGPRVRAGVCCLIRTVRPRLMACDKVYRFRILESVASPQYIELALNEPAMIEYINTLKTGISDSGVNLTQDKFRALEIALPPLEEQREIVRRVEALFKVADSIEARYKKAKASVEKLTQSILAKAFRGELVPQDPNDEPASVLLERIKAEKAPLNFSARKKKTSERSRKTAPRRRVAAR